MENQGKNEDGSQSDPHPEAGLFRCQTLQNSGPEVGHDMVTGVIQETHNGADMVTGVQREICYRPDMVTGVIEKTHNGHDMVRRVQKQSLCGHDMVTRVQKESLCGHGMVTGATEQICNRHDMVTGGSEEIRNGHDMKAGVQKKICFCPHMVTAVQEGIPYCSSGKKAHSTSHQQFRSQNTPATLEANQIRLALQQLATNSNSANFNNKITRISKLPKSLTTTMPTFDGKSEKFELFEYLFQTSLKIHNQFSEEEKIY